MEYTINDLQNDTEYTFTLKTIDNNNNASEGKIIKVTPEDKTPPANITNLTAESGEQCITLAWLNPCDTDFKETHITFSPEAEGIEQPIVIQGESNKASSIGIKGLQNYTTYTFLLNTFDRVGNKSETITIEASPKDMTPPAEISNFEIISNNKRLILNWTNPSDSDFKYIEISASPAEGSLVESEKLNNNLFQAFSMAESVLISGSPSEQHSYTLIDLENGKDYEITLKTIDTNGNSSIGVSKTAIPQESIISLEVTLPNDDGQTVTLTNDNAPVNVQITSNYKIIKAVYKKGKKDVLPNAEKLLTDVSATNLSIDSNHLQFIVSENGIYDIAVKNYAGTTEYVRAEVKTIVKNSGLRPIQNLKSTCDGEYVYLTWTDPVAESKYISPVKSIFISYYYNNDETTKKEVEVNAGTEKLSIKIDDDITEYDYITIKTTNIDMLGNKCTYYQEPTQQYCNPYINVSANNLLTTIEKMTESGKIIVYDSFSSDSMSYITNALRTLKDSNPSIKIALDFSKCKFSGYNYGGWGFGGFSNCSNLTYIKLPSSIGNIISTNAFFGCTNLSTIELPYSITKIGDNAFENCSSLKHISLPYNVNTIGYDAFSGCSSLENITIPDEVTTIQANIFYGCSNLTTINLPSRVTEIQSDAFYGCTSLKQIIIPDSVKEIGAEVFYGCKNLEQITIPDEVTTIYANTFYGCSNLTSIKLPSKLTEIKENAFYACSSIEQITLSNEVKKIGTSAFYECNNLKKINIPTSITSISSKAFYGCSKLDNIIIPESITKLPVELFANCTSLTNISLPNNLTAIDHYVFENCTNLKTIDFPEGLTSIGGRAFNNCSKLYTINIPDTVTEIAKGAFTGCNSLKSITIPNQVMKPGIFSTPNNITTITLLNGGSEIPDETFKKFTALTSIEIPSSVEKIGKEAFKGCSTLSSVKIPSSVNTIDSMAFSDCNNLTEADVASKTVSTENSRWKRYVNGTEIIRGLTLDAEDLTSGYAWYRR